MRLTGLMWGNLSMHLRKLEDTGYVEIEKGYKGRKPRTTIRLSDDG
ncbi:MAG: transcriptional regulator [Anaerolineae bacterium]|nr:transcriptional regulator [Anaerolineae bacterium]